MCPRNLSSMSASSPKMEENNLSLFLLMSVLMSDGQERPFWSQLAFKTYISGLRFYRVMKLEKNWHLIFHRHRITPRQTSPIPPFPINTLHEWPQPSLPIVPYTVQRRSKRITTQSQYNTIPCGVHDITCKSAMSWNCSWGRSAVWGYHELCISL